jgi:tryptophanyl-tRNA synthetase
MNRIFSGVQPTGALHLRNYLGAIRNWVRLQEEFDCIFCVVDLHAITVWQDPTDLRHNTRLVAAALLAAGIDPKRSTLFVQSQVAAHAQLAWLFNCIARLGWLKRMTQFKEKAGKNQENASVGLFAYPNLMAADILAYKATHVPVGEDQKQHLELARDIAIKFNHDYETDLFPVVEPLILGPAARVMSLKDGTKKMSKSDPSEQSRINLTDDTDTIALKIRKARTDPEPLPGDEDGLRDRAEAANLIGIFAALTDADVGTVCSQFGGAQFSAFKKELSDVAVATLSPITAEMRRLEADPAYVDEILGDGAKRAAAITEPILAEVYATVGLAPPQSVFGHS